jgi:signal transduction histidine kinase
MVGDLFDASRIETKQLTVERFAVDVATFVREAVERAAPITEGHSVIVDVHENLEPVELDPGRIEQVLVNLLANASKYGSRSTDIRVEVADCREGVEISVSNHGHAIGPDEIDRLFSRFYRTRRAKERTAEGLGLGLYIARGIVEAHRGKIFARMEGEDTVTFGFVLPRC